MKRMSRGTLVTALIAGLCNPVLAAGPATASHLGTNRLSPNGFITNTGGWHEESGDATDKVLFDELDDSGAGDDDTTKVRSVAIGPNDPRKYFRVNLEATEEPNSNDNHELVLRAKKGSSGGAEIRLFVELWRGGNQVDTTTTGALTSSFANYGEPYDAVTENIEDITDDQYKGGDLELRIAVEPTPTSSGDDRAAHVTMAYVDVPENSATDSCSGVTVDGGGSDLQDTMATEPAGTTFCVSDNANALTYTATGDGLPIQDNDVIDGETRANPKRGDLPNIRVTAQAGVQFVLDADVNGADNIVIEDMSLRGGEDDPVDPDGATDDGDKDGITADLDPGDPGDDGKCWTNEDDVDGPGGAGADDDAEQCGAVVRPGNNWTISRSRIWDSETAGIRAPGSDLYVWNAQIDQNGLRFNENCDPGDQSPACENNGISAGIKGGAAGAFSVEYSHVFNNDQGVWCDVDCPNTGPGGIGEAADGEFFVQQSEIEDHCSFGIHFENSDDDDGDDTGADIGYNLVHGNTTCDIDTVKSDIGVISAEDGNVHDNIIKDVSGASPGTNPGVQGDDGFDSRDTQSRNDTTDTVFHDDNHLGDGDDAQCQDGAICERTGV